MAFLPERGLFFSKRFVILIDVGDCQQDTSSRTDSAHEVGKHGESTNAKSTESGSNGDVAVELLNQRFVTVSNHHHLLITELFGNILGRGTRHVNPGLGEQSAGSENESDVEQSVERISGNGGEGTGRRQVVGKSSDGDHLSLSRGVFGNSPLSQQVNENVVGITSVEELRQEVEIGNEGGLQNDGDVGGIEQLDGVGTSGTSLLFVFDGKVDTEALEINDNDEDEDGGHEVGDVGEVLAIEGLLEGANLVVSGDQKVEQSNDSSFEFRSTSSVNSGRAESLPDDGFANVGGDEERNTRAETISLLQEFVQNQDDDTSNKQLDDDNESEADTEFRNGSVHAGENVGDGLTDGNNHTEQFLGSLEEFSIRLDALIDLDDV